MSKLPNRLLSYTNLLLLAGTLLGVIQIPAMAQPDPLPRLIGFPQVSPHSRSLQSTSEPGRAAVSVDLSLIDPSQLRPARLEAWLGDSAVVLKLNRTETRGEANYTWVGEVEGSATSSVILTVVDGILCGRIRFDDRAFSLEHHGTGYTLTDLNQLAPGSLLDDMRQPAAPAASRQPDQAVAQPDAGPAQMDVLVLYTAELASRYPTQLAATIQHVVDVANQAYANSGINAQLRLVGSVLHNSTNILEGISACTALGNLTDDPNVIALRDQYGADLVSLLRGFNGTNCGCGWVMSAGMVGPVFSENAFSVVEVGNFGGFYCLDTSFAHELGHNMGCTHDRDHAGGIAGAFSYSYGYDIPGQFATIMSYDQPRIEYFSTPQVLYNGQPIGIAEGQPDSADNARTINYTAPVVSAFRQSAQAPGDKHIQITTRGYIHSSPLLYDINQDGYREILVGDMAGYVYCFRRDGVKLWEYYAGNAFDKSISPVPTWFNAEAQNNNSVGNVTIQSSCAAGDIDGDALPEIIVGVGGFVDGGPGGGTATGYGPVGQGGTLVLNRDGTLRLLIRSWDTYDGLANAVHDGYGDGVFSTPGLADLDGDGKLDFAIAGTDQNINAFKFEFKNTSRDPGTGRTARFFRPPSKDGFWATPIFELDDDGDGRFNEDPFGQFTPFSLFGVESTFKAGFPGMDDDGDGLVDEGTIWDDDEDSSSTPSIVNWDFSDEDEFEWPFRTTDTVISSPAMADLTGDGYPDVVVGGDSSGGTPLKSDRKPIPYGGALRAMTRSTDEIGDFPQPIEQVVWSSPAVADVNRDGSLEVFVGTGFVVSTGGVYKGKGVYAFNQDGTPFLPGKSPYGLFAATSDVVYVSPACGDIDGDGNLEIIAADFQTTSPASSGGYLYAWRPNGTLLPGFPMQPLAEFASMIGNPAVRFAQARSSPILADVDNDGRPEIVMGMGWSMVAVNHDGSMVPEFRFTTGNPLTAITTGTTLIQATPAAADLDNNGKIDLVWATGHSSNGGATIDYGTIHIWENSTFGSPAPSANPWPAFKRTGTRTSSGRLQFENPVFTPPLTTVNRGQAITVSVQVYGDSTPISSVRYQVEINGSTTQVTLRDDGTGSDALSGDGRYTGQFTLPSQITTIRNSSFVAQSSLTSLTERFSVPYRHINIYGQVSRYYQSVLGRAPDPVGAQFWTDEIERVAAQGIDLREGFQAAAKIFFNCEEYQLKNRTDSQFVDDLYLTFLNRVPDAAGKAFWLDYLSQGLTRNMLITQFAYSEEFGLQLESIFGGSIRRPENNLLNDLYRGFLGRFADDAGFYSWLGQLRDAQCNGSQALINLVNSITLGFIQSQEYALRNRDNSQFVEDLYNGILRRGADPAGFAGWVSQLSSHSRADILQEFTASAEFQFRVQEIIEAGCLQ